MGSQGDQGRDLIPNFPVQLVWLLRELVKSGVLGADGVCMTFMKQIAGEQGWDPLGSGQGILGI